MLKQFRLNCGLRFHLQNACEENARSYNLAVTFIWYCNVLEGSIHNGTLLHSKFNTQLLITISSAPNSVQPLLVLQYNSLVHSKSLKITRHNHRNVSVSIVAFVTYATR
jgi:hypothetical protein